MKKAEEIKFIPINLRKKLKQVETPIIEKKPEVAKSKMFIVRTLKQCLDDASKLPVPNQIFDELWHEGQTSFLFAESGIGKSVLACQIGVSIASGAPIQGFNMEIEPQKVLYLDFELHDKQIEKRFSRMQSIEDPDTHKIHKTYYDHYNAPENFLRITRDPYFEFKNNWEDEMFANIENLLVSEKAKILIVDNLTFMSEKSTEKSGDALPLMKRLHDLKMRNKLSMLVLGHTPKRNMCNPITKNDLMGSVHLQNFIDGLFAIGRSQQDINIRYIKQLKERDSGSKFHGENVAIMNLDKKHNFLCMESLGTGREDEHLKIQTKEDEVAINEEIILLRQKNPDLSNYEIAKRIGINQMRVARTLKNHSNEHIEKKPEGKQARATL